MSSVKVAVRVRPFASRENNRRSKCIIGMHGATTSKFVSSLLLILIYLFNLKISGWTGAEIYLCCMLNFFLFPLFGYESFPKVPWKYDELELTWIVVHSSLARISILILRFKDYYIFSTSTWKSHAKLYIFSGQYVHYTQLFNVLRFIFVNLTCSE